MRGGNWGECGEGKAITECGEWARGGIWAPTVTIMLAKCPQRENPRYESAGTNSYIGHAGRTRLRSAKAPTQGG